MNDDLEPLLGRLAPRGAPPELRGRILEAVSRELAAAAADRPPRRFPARTATAALLLLAVGLNHLATVTDEARLTRVFGRPSASRRALELAREVAEYGGPEAGRWILDRLADLPPPPTAPTTEADLRRRAGDLERLARDPTFDPREIDDEATSQAVPQVGRDRRRPPPGRLLALERGLHLDHRTSA